MSTKRFIIIVVSAALLVIAVTVGFAITKGRTDGPTPPPSSNFEYTTEDLFISLLQEADWAVFSEDEIDEVLKLGYLACSKVGSGMTTREVVAEMKASNIPEYQAVYFVGVSVSTLCPELNE